jgi:hypothetical protein
VFNIRFKLNINTFDYLAVGDSEWEVLEDIVQKSKKHGNEDRLSWDLYNIPHHCSYKALSDEKGKTETIPKDMIQELLLSGKEGAYLVSSSDPINDNKEGLEQEQPPHIQARKCYENYLKQVDGCKFLVTMEESSPTDPKPIEFIIDDSGLTLEKSYISAASIITSNPARRAGK